MSELLQIQKTAEDIFPEWCEAVRNYEKGVTLLPPKLSVNSGQCVVGEAHGFHGNYSFMGIPEKFCNECSLFAYKMVNRDCPNPGRIAISIGSHEDGSEYISRIDEHFYEELKEQFVKHWNDKHI